MHTKDKLAEALRSVGLTEMADKAATGYYHDYLSPLALPEMQLLTDLGEAANGIKDPDKRIAVLKVRDRHMSGEFDASTEESEAWADSPEGQAAMRMLTRGRAE